MVNEPSINAEQYFVNETEDIAPKHGTTVQAGWDAAMGFLKPKKAAGNYPKDFKITESSQLVRFLDDEPFFVYQQHWLTRTEGKRSFVCLGDDCPLCTLLGDQPRPKCVFNVLVLTDEEPNVQLLTATPSLAKILYDKNQDPRLGPLSKYFWAISRSGTALTTRYNVERIKAMDLASEWELDIEDVETAIANAVKWNDSAVYVSPREELLEIARSLVS